MRKKIVKLVLAAAMLTGSLGVGLAPRTASAISCPPICCNSGCTSVRICVASSQGCLCRPYCQPAGGGGID